MIGDADSRNVGSGRVRFGDRLAHALLCAKPDLVGVMLNPAGLGHDLFVLVLCDRDDAVAVEQNAARAGRALIDGGDVFRHSYQLSANHSGKSGPASGRVKKSRPGIVGIQVLGSQALGPYFSVTHRLIPCHMAPRSGYAPSAPPMQKSL